MEELELALKEVMSKLGKEIEARLREFERKRSREEIFLELAFCLLVANYRLEKALEILEELGEEITTLDEVGLKKELRRLGYRFWNKRAGYLIEARRRLDEVIEVVERKRPKEAREWMVKNVKGLGYKEASHFLRNLGVRDLAILDRHVMRILKRYGMTNYDATPPKSEYLRIEQKLRGIASKLGMDLAELDLCLFFLATGKLPKR